MTGPGRPSTLRALCGSPSPTRSAGRRSAAGAERFLPELAAALASPRPRGHALVRGLGAGRIRRPGGADDPAARAVTRRSTATRPTSAGACSSRLTRERFDAVHSLGRHDTVASIRAARLRRDGRRTVVTDLGLPDPVWWRQQGRREARAAASRGPRGRRLHARCRRPPSTRSPPATGAATGSSSPAASTWRPSPPPPARAPRPAILFSGAITEPRKGVGGAARRAAADRRRRARGGGVAVGPR